MTSRVEVLVATVDRNDFLEEKMNLQTPAIIANQTNETRIVSRVYSGNRIIEIRSNSRGVGINRNIGIDFSKEEYLLFLDDDMVLFDGYEKDIISEFASTNSDIIIFNFLYCNSNGQTRKRLTKSQRVNKLNGLKYGICATAIKKKTLDKFNLHFSPMFGGGSKYGSGEDSLFFLDAMRNGLKISTSNILIGTNVERKSTWFTGYDEKYFFDKGAWICCAYPRVKLLMILYYTLRFKSITKCNFFVRFNMLKLGVKAFKNAKTYREVIQE